MPAKSAPLNATRHLVTGDKKLPPKIQALLDNPVLCSKIAGVWTELQAGMVSIIMDLPLFCKAHGLDASATVLAANKILTTFEVIKDQGEEDKKKPR